MYVTSTNKVFGGLSLSSINKNQRLCAIKHQGFMPNSDVDPLEFLLAEYIKSKNKTKETKDQQ